VNAIETERLTKRFRQLRGYRDLALYPLRRSTDVAVEEVTLQIAQGELFGLLGENGAGKTTLIRMLSTTLLPTSGRAVVGGHDVVHEPHAVRNLIGLVSGDDRTFYWRLTGRQNLEFFAALYHVPRRIADRRIRELLETLDVGSFAVRRFNTYSTGIRQKFAIARGLLTEPRVLFLDEPTRALDPIAADEVRRYVADHIVGRMGYTVLLATHTLSEAQAICHRVAIIRHGKVVAAGSMDELSARMALSTVFELVVAGTAGRLRDAIGTVPGIQDVRARRGRPGAAEVQLGPRGHADRGLGRSSTLAPASSHARLGDLPSTISIGRHMRRTEGLALGGWAQVARATFTRDRRTATSYRTGFLLTFGIHREHPEHLLLEQAFGLATPVESYGESYFGFAVMGVAFSTFMGVGLTGIGSRIREEPVDGDLD
jgi:ABC-2 type transport system ATP-binding protein